MISTAALVVLLQLPLPSVPLPSGFPGGANLDRLALDLSGVVKGEMPDVPPVSFPLTGFGLPQTTPPVPLEPGQVIRVEWQRRLDIFRPVKVRLWLDGAIVKNFVTADLTVTGANVHGTTQTFSTNAGVIPPFTADQIGPHTFALTWYDANGTGGSSTLESRPEDVSLPVVVGFTTPPPPGTGFKISGVTAQLAADGTVKVTISVVPEVVK